MSLDNNFFNKTIVVIDDDEINREILKNILSDSYVVREAENGQEGLDLLKQLNYNVSLILLDIQMPIMNGYQFLDESNKIDQLKSIPIIVTTSEKEDEEKCLNNGASDFVTKPYNAKIILKRIQALIRLSESSLIINKTKYDSVTKLYSRTYFDVAANVVFSQNDGNQSFILLSIEDFQYINAIYGEVDGDNLLKYIAKIVFSLDETNCLTSRYGSEKFAIYVRTDLDGTLKLIEQIKDSFYANSPLKNVHLKFAYYLNPNKSLNVVKIYDRLSSALETIYHNYVNDVAEYNNNMLVKKNRERFIRENMYSSLNNGEFDVFFQPKHDPLTNDLCGAEALVRWNHPKAKLISPNDFIPLFEETGFITDLDKYVVDKTCSYMKDILARGIKPFPVSINLSRRDIAIMDSLSKVDSILDKYGISKNLIHFEITESTAGENKDLLNRISELRTHGYKIEIDDFGSGYSSLGMIADIPMDYLKLDMSFAKNYLKQKSIIKTIIALAHDLNVKIIAEGIEEKEQLDFYVSAGVDYIQGYYYSKPLCFNDFITYLNGCN